MNLEELIRWHSEQLAELQREQDGIVFAEFHADAVELLENLNSLFLSVSRVIEGGN